MDLKKGPNTENNLLAIILENFNPIIIKKINKQLINKNCKKYFRRLDIIISNEKDFGSRGSFVFSSSRIKLPIQVGEAGGFQDYLFGFGMKMSMMSGYFAGLYMNGEKTNAKLLLKTINKKRDPWCAILKEKNE